jgi:hypothetical protein
MLLWFFSDFLLGSAYDLTNTLKSDTNVLELTSFSPRFFSIGGLLGFLKETLNLLSLKCSED